MRRFILAEQMDGGIRLRMGFESFARETPTPAFTSDALIAIRRAVLDEIFRRPWIQPGKLACIRSAADPDGAQRVLDVLAGFSRATRVWGVCDYGDIPVVAADSLPGQVIDSPMERPTVILNGIDAWSGDIAVIHASVTRSFSGHDYWCQGTRRPEAEGGGWSAFCILTRSWVA
jgi:hypothetical protein